MWYIFYFNNSLIAYYITLFSAQYKAHIICTILTKKYANKKVNGKHVEPCFNIKTRLTTYTVYRFIFV